MSWRHIPNEKSCIRLQVHTSSVLSSLSLQSSILVSIINPKVYGGAKGV